MLPVPRPQFRHPGDDGIVPFSGLYPACARALPHCEGNCNPTQRPRFPLWDAVLHGVLVAMARTRARLMALGLAVRQNRAPAH